MVNLTRMFTGFLTVLLIPIFLTESIQGYWYSFGSISALSVLADLGFTSIIVQFAAHEFAFLKKNPLGQFEGNEIHLQRLFSFFRYVLKRGCALVIIAFPIIFVLGYFILNSDKSIPLNSWLFPWVIFVIFSGVYFLLNLLSAFFEGCGFIAVIQKLRYICNLITFGVTCLCLYLGMNLYALALGISLGSILLGIQLWYNYKTPVKQFFRELKITVNWNPEILHLLFRYALSFIGGVLIFQLFVPIAFKFYGPAFAGRVGITITLMMAVFQVSNIWIYVSIPKLNMLVSEKKTKELFPYFKKNLLLSLITFIVLGTISIILLSLLPDRYSSRFLPMRITMLLLFVWFLQLIINSIATFSRAHKVEKFVYPSLVTGIYIAITTMLIAIYLPSNYFFLGFFTSYIFAFPWFYYIFSKHKNAIEKNS